VTARWSSRILPIFFTSSTNCRAISPVFFRKILRPSIACRGISRAPSWPTSWRPTDVGELRLTMRAFSQADRFFSDLESRKLKPAYVLVGDEAFFRKRCRDAILEHLVAPDSRDFGLFEFDLAETSLNEVLDRARTPSLMAPFQVFFVRGVKSLFGRGSGSNAEKIAALETYCKNPNPDALLVFVADHISIPADARRMEMTDKDRYQKIREDLGPFC